MRQQAGVAHHRFAARSPLFHGNIVDLEPVDVTGLHRLALGLLAHFKVGFLGDHDQSTTRNSASHGRRFLETV